VIHDGLTVIFWAITILLIPVGTRLSREWENSFYEWKEYDRWLMSQEEDLYERLGEWREVADRIDRGEHPYNGLTDALTQQFRTFAQGMIQHLEHQLAKIREERGT
jgi:hypothetical protein